MRDITLEDTFYHDFTTRAFSSGVPTTLAGTPVLSVLEENNVTPITAGVSISVDRATVTGLNEATIVATAANGYETGKSYSIYISTGTVDAVSVVGEVVGQFTIEKSAAAIDLANATDGLGAIKTGVDGVPTTAEFEARTILSAAYFDPAADTVANVTTVATTTTNTDMRGTDSALLAASAPTNFGDLAITVTTGNVTVGTNNDKTGYSLTQAFPTNFSALGISAGGAIDNVTLTATCTTNTDMLTAAAVNAEVVDALITDTYAEPGQGTPAATASIKDKLGYIYKFLRNKKTATSTTISVFNDDAVTVDQKSTISDDTTTYTEGEYITGP